MDAGNFRKISLSLQLASVSDLSKFPWTYLRRETGSRDFIGLLQEIPFHFCLIIRAAEQLRPHLFAEESRLEIYHYITCHKTGCLLKISLLLNTNSHYVITERM